VPRLHAIAADEVLDRRGFVDDARALLDWGGPEVALHLRAHGRPGGALFALARRLAPVAQASGALLVVNDRVDVALAAAIEAVQLGVRSLPLASARAIVPAGTLLGYSAHAADEAAEAAVAGADWLLLGTIYPTGSHPGREGAGPGLIAAAAQALQAGPGPRPVIAIGGLTPERVVEVVAAGAHGVAVLRGIWSAPVPFRAAAAFRDALAAATGQRAAAADDE
jgi:thiamine-phosphate pyrophosphorylase